MVRFGIAGFGLHAVKRLMPGFAAAKRCIVTALSRRDSAKAAAAAAEHGIPYTFADVAELAHCPYVDAVFVSSPDALHKQDTLTALAAGKPVLCEKPMAMNAAEARAMVDAADRGGLLLGVAHVFRFEESVNAVREIVARGELGDIREASLSFDYPALNSPRQWIADAQLACGGPIGDVGVHCIDTLRYILQEQVTSVTTEAEQDERSGDLESAARLELQFACGAVAKVSVSARQPYATPFRIVGDSGSLQAEDFLTVEHPVAIQVTTGSGRRQHIASNHGAYAAQVDAFAAAIEDDASFPCPATEGLKNQLILDAAYQSWRMRKVIAL